MSGLTYSSYDGFGKDVLDAYHYSQAVRVPPNRIECAGQGGWDPKSHDIPSDITAEIAQAFENVELTLTTAGLKEGWKNVFSVKSYHVGDIDEKVLEAMVGNMKKWTPGHRPIWTCLGVATLALPGMRVEIDVVAFDPEAK